MMQAEFADQETRHALYQEATDGLIRAEKIMKGSGAWLMSCIHARQNNGDLCLRWLERAKKSSLLPDADSITGHAHFTGVLEETWFITWIETHD